MVKVLLDIDGVLNPFLADGAFLPASFAPVQEGWASWRLDFGAHRRYLLELEGEAELIWASSWEEDSNLVNRRFGLAAHTYPHVDLSRAAGEGTWKLPAIQRYLADSDEAVVWLDDELEADAWAWAASRPDTLLIQCDPAVGWTNAQYGEVLAFVRSHPKVLRTEPAAARFGLFKSFKKRKSP